MFLVFYSIDSSLERKNSGLLFVCRMIVEHSLVRCYVCRPISTSYGNKGIIVVNKPNGAVAIAS